EVQLFNYSIIHLSKAYSYFYLNYLTINHRQYLQRLVLTLYNQQNSITSNNIKGLLEDSYLNISSLTTTQRIYTLVFYFIMIKYLMEDIYHL
ncbi:unnamed protein product, partial [Rotaria sordida]